MTIRRMVFVVESPLSPRDYVRFGIGALQAQGLHTEAWEVDAIYLPRADGETATRSAECTIQRFRNERSLVSAIEDLGPDTCILTLSGIDRSQGWTHGPLREAFARTAAVVSTFSSGHRPPEPHTRAGLGLSARTRARAQSLTTTTAAAFGNPARMRLLTRRMKERTARAGLPIHIPQSICHFDFVWAGTSIDQIDPALIGPATAVRYIHTLDYDDLLNLNLVGLARTIPALYIDTMGPSHPDFAVSHIPVMVEPDVWFGQVSQALSEYEAATGSMVVIAAHPRANPVDVARWYGGREVTTLGTPEAIARAQAVLVTNASTSLGLVAALHTPALVIRPPAIHETHLAQLDDYARMLALPVYDLADPPAQWPAPRADLRHYAQFVEQYMKRAGTPEISFWQQVADDLAQV